MYIVFDIEHYQKLLMAYPSLKPTEYLYLKGVANMQRLEKYDYWCVMPNSDFCRWLNYKDSGLRKMQKKLQGMRLLDIGSGTQKRATDRFLQDIVYGSPQSSDSEKVATTPPQSSDQKRHKVATTPPQSSDKREKKDKDKDKENIVLPFSSDSFKDVWVDWEKHRREIKKALKPMTRSRQLKQLAKHDEQTAIAMLEQSIEKGWTGIFEVKKRRSETNWALINQTPI